jgi:hypothetical protein
MGRLLTLVYFIQKYRSSQIFGLFFHGKSYVLILTKSALGYILGDFFSNLSGHPVMAPMTEK